MACGAEVLIMAPLSTLVSVCGGLSSVVIAVVVVDRVLEGGYIANILGT